MFKKYGIKLLAVCIAAAAAAFTTPSKNVGPKDVFYYKYTGPAGSEDVMANWQQLETLGDYTSFNCPSGSVKGCKIQNSTNSGGHPTSVPLDGNGLPTPTSPNIAVANRN